MHNTTYIKEFMDYYDYPQEAISVINEALDKINNTPAIKEGYCALLNDMVSEKISIADAIAQVEKFGEDKGIDERTISLIFIIDASQWAKEKYIQKGIPLQVFFDTFRDLRYKLIECMEVEHTVGTFVAGWFRHHLDVHIFALGRFQYEVTTAYIEEPFTVGGVTINPGDPILSLHIPSSGIPLTDEIRYDSYKKAYEFFKGMFNDGTVHFMCGSWLLYPKAKEFLPPHLNVLRFMDDFTIAQWEEKDSFGDDWRLFADKTDLPLEEWPEDTSMRKAYKHWMMNGGKTGEAIGVIIFDGEKIVK